MRLLVTKNAYMYALGKSHWNWAGNFSWFKCKGTRKTVLLHVPGLASNSSTKG